MMAARLLLLALAAALPLQAPAEVKGPFDARGRAALVARQDDPFACPRPQPATRDIRIEEYYADKAFSVVDEKRRRQADRSAEPLHRYAREVTRLADRALLQREGREEVIACLMRWLEAWAEGDAMLGEIEGPLAQHYRKWTLASVALAYAGTRPLVRDDDRRRAGIERWLRQLVEAMDRYYATWRRESWNNHVYWQGLAEAAVAVAVDDRRLLEDAVAKYRHAVDAITPDGLLPKEVARREKAFGYHAFSLVPLVLLAEIGERNGIPMYDQRDGAIHRLADAVAKAAENPASFERMVGRRQDRDPRGKVWELAWMEPYLARFPDARRERMLAPHRPISHEWLGGNLTLRFAGIDAVRSGKQVPSSHQTP